MDNENTNGKEIDVLEVLDAIAKRFGRFFSTLIKGLSKLFLAIIYFVFRNTIAVGVILVVTVGIGIYSYFSTESHFESDMKIKGNAITNQEAISYINKLSELTNPENKSILMKRLEIDSAMAQNISEIRAYWFIDLDGDGVENYLDLEENYFRADDDSVTQRINDFFDVKVKYKGEIEIDQLSQKIVDYISKNKYFAQKNKIRIEQLTGQNKTTLTELSRIDTVRSKYYESVFENNLKPEARSGQLVFLNGEPTTDLSNLKLYYDEIFKLEIKSQLLVNELAVNPDIVTVLEDLYLSKTKEENALDYGNRAFLFLFSALFVLFLFDNRAKISDLKNLSKHK